MLIDFHTHCFPDKIAERAIAKLSYVSGGIKPNTDGTLCGLLSSMDAQSVDTSVVLNIATNAHQQKSVNDFAASIKSDRIVPFGSVFPEAELSLLGTLNLSESDRAKILFENAKRLLHLNATK